MDPFLIAALSTSLISGIGNMIEGNSEREQRQKYIETAGNFIKQSIVDENELALMLNNSERLFNNRLISTLNTNAIRSRGIANREVIGGAIAGAMEGDKLVALENIRSKVLQHNTEAYNKLASLELEKPIGSSGGDFVTGFVGGIPAGLEVGKLFKPDPSINLKPFDNGLGTKPASLNSPTGYQGMGNPPKSPYMNNLWEDELTSKTQLWNTINRFS